MAIKQFLAVAFVGLILSGCKSDSVSDQKQTCEYSFPDSQTTLEWTAYKFTDKTPVKGTFNEIEISTVSEASSVEELIGSLGFSIPVASLETQDELKNNNIIKGFFQFMGTSVLNGQVVEMDETDLTFEVEMNGVKQKVHGKYEMVGSTFSFRGTMNLTLFGANKAIESLNAQCGVNHTGTDGVTVVSDKVDIHFTTLLDKTCK